MRTEKVQDQSVFKRPNDLNSVLPHMRLVTRFSCWDVLKKMDLDFWGSMRLRFPSEMLLTTLRGLFSEPEERENSSVMNE